MLTPATIPIMEQTLKLHLRQMLAGEVARTAERRDGSLPGRPRHQRRVRRPRRLHPAGRERAARGARRRRLADGGPRLGRAGPPVRLVKTIGDAVMYVSDDPVALLGRARSTSRARPTSRARTSRSCASASPSGQAITPRRRLVRAPGQPRQPDHRDRAARQRAWPASRSKDAAPDDQFRFSFIGAAQAQGRARANRAVPGAKADGRRGRRGRRALTPRRRCSSAAAPRAARWRRRSAPRAPGRSASARPTP